MNILFLADFCPNNRLKDNKLLLESVSKEIQAEIASSSYSIVNFECSVVLDGFAPLQKQGPNLGCSEECVEVLKEIGVSAVTLANNHILDYGDSGLSQTFRDLDTWGIEYVGAGDNVEKASAVLYKSIDDARIAFINCCEHEYSVATEQSAGANPLNPIKLFYQIQEAKQLADYVFLIVHGGVEHFQYPTKRMVETYRFFVDAGADAVINHHQHCPCGYEVYKGKPIYYGLGNFCFDWQGKQNSIWNLGYMVRIELKGNHLLKSEIIPYGQCGEEPVVKLLDERQLEKFNKMMDELNTAIQDKTQLEKKLKEFNKKNEYLYKKMLEPYSGKIMNGLYRRGLMPSTMSRERILALMDFLICESHYERVKEFLERTYKEYCK